MKYDLMLEILTDKINKLGNKMETKGLTDKEYEEFNGILATYRKLVFSSKSLEEAKNES